jgi:hypothetical protein
MGSMTILITAAVLFLLVWITSVFVTSGLARRDHSDRSVEFWLSLPTGHAESYAAPLLVHLLLAPAAALLVGLAGGYAMSLLVVSRFLSLSEWLSLPWGHILAATVALAGRVLAGLPLATLWLSPLILLAVLCNALFKRWGLPVLAVGLGLGGVVLKYVFGQPLLSQALARLGNEAATALLGASQQSPTGDRPSAETALGALPAWAAHDLGAGPARAFWRVTFPLSLPGVVAGSLLVFIPASGEFVIPDLLGGPDTPMVGRILWLEFFQNRDWPVACAIATVLGAILAGPILLFDRLRSRNA